MRIIRFFLVYVMVNILVLLVGTFLAQNVRAEHVAFFGLNVQTNFVWILLGAASAGFLAAALLLIPGRVIVGLRVWELDREANQLENQITLLEEQREDLITRHEVLVQAREHALDRYHRLVADYNKMVAERDGLRVESRELKSLAARLKSVPAEAKVPAARPKASTPRLESRTTEPEAHYDEPESTPEESESFPEEAVPPATVLGVLSGPVRLVEQLELPKRLQRLQRLLPTFPGSVVND